MLVETDREKYAIQRIVDFYERQPTDYADYFQAAWRFKHRAALGKPDATLAAHRGGSEGEREVSADDLADSRGNAGGGEAGSGPDRQTAGDVARPAGAGRKARRTSARKCVEMRDFVVRIRNHTAMQFAAPVVKGLPAGSQPLLNWKLRAFNAHRREFDPQRSAQRYRSAAGGAGDPEISRAAPGSGVRAGRALMQKARVGDPDLVVPAAERDRYEASFARFASVFPDAFYVKSAAASSLTIRRTRAAC